MNVCKQKGKVNQLVQEKGGEIVVSLQGRGGWLLDTGANEVIMRRGDTEFTTVLCNEVLHYRSIWQLN